MRVMVAFDTRYGNTEKVARALTRGIQRDSIEVTCSNINDLQISTLVEYDLLVIGGPTQYHGISEPMKDFLEKLEAVNLKGKFGFAFDTRVNSFWSGSAAQAIERKIKRFGVEIVKPHSSAFVKHTETGVEEKTQARETKEERRARKARVKEERRASAVLEESAEDTFEKIGIEIGRILQTKSKTASVSARSI
jgi:flavorubredoxin